MNVSKEFQSVTTVLSVFKTVVLCTEILMLRTTSVFFGGGGSNVTSITISREYYYCYYFIVNMLLGSVDTVMMQYRETPAEGGASMES